MQRENRVLPARNSTQKYALARAGVEVGLGQRISKSPVIGATVYHYDLSGKLIAESDSFGVTQKEYVYLYDQPVAVYGSMATSQCSATPAEVNGTSFTAKTPWNASKAAAANPAPPIGNGA